MNNTHPIHLNKEGPFLPGLKHGASWTGLVKTYPQERTVSDYLQKQKRAVGKYLQRQTVGEYLQKRSVRVSLIIALCVVILVGLVVRAQLNPASAAGFPTQYFAPFTETGNNFPLTQSAQKTGAKFYTLSFIVDHGGQCNAGWDDGSVLSKAALLTDVTNLRALGGDVIVSFGGASGTDKPGDGAELAINCPNVAALQAQYQKVIDTYSLTHIDFDIEGNALYDPNHFQASITLRNKAIKGLEDAAKQSGKQLSVSYTLPVGTTGLEPGSISLLKDAVQNGATVNMVDVMAMDYGQNTPNMKLGPAALSATNGLLQQLPTVFTTQLPQIGVTVLIGKQDSNAGTFTLADAQQLETFAQQKKITMLSMWDSERDVPCGGGSNDPTLNCSGTTQTPFGFTKIFTKITGGTTIQQPLVVNHVALPATTPGNLLSNPGFESGLTGWTGSSADTVVSVATNVHGGQSALQIATSAASDGKITQTVAVKANQTYMLQVYVKGAQAALGVSGHSGEASASAGTTYTLLSMAFTTDASTTSETITLHGVAGATGVVYADDFSLVVV